MQSQTVQIKEGRTVSLTFKNQPKGELIIQKRDSASGQPLSGAEFRLTTAAGCEVGLDGVIGDSTLTQNGIFTTDANGEIHITNLAPGAYVITEIKAPTGYVMDQPSTNVVIGANGDTQTVVIKNSKAGSLIIDKRDSLTGAPLEGVTFKVTTATGEYVPDENGYISSNGLYFTDKDGKIQINGVVGTLVVTETATIPGYTIDPATQTQTVVVNPNDTQTLHFTNTPSTTLVIEKYIEGTTTPLKGVTFLVTDSSGAVVGPSNGEYITDENGRIVITDLEPGTTVTAREVKTLEGYVLDSTPKSILIKTGEVQTLRFYNQAAGTIVIRKLDSVTKEPLAGVEFELTYADGGYVDDANGHLSSLGLYTTDSNGEIRISGVTGTIVVKETKTIEGYTIDPASRMQTVTVNPEDTQTLTFYNDPTGRVEIIKVNAADKTERIPNTTFEIRKVDDELIDTVTTDENGRVFLSLEDGAYYAVEIKAGDGFKLDDTPHYFEVEDGKTTLLQIENAAFSGILIHKTDSATGEGLYGVTFLLYANGLGVEADDAEAEHWFRLAAEKENLFAQNALASLLLTQGKPEEAALWLERAAKQGNPAAQYALGRLHLLGTGVPQDRVLAMELLGRSAAQGDSRAAELAKEPERVSFLPAAMAVTRMLHHMSRIFEHNCKQDQVFQGLQIDRKRWRELQELRIAMGHMPDDHEEIEISLR